MKQNPITVLRLAGYLFCYNVGAPRYEFNIALEPPSDLVRCCVLQIKGNILLQHDATV